MFSRFIILICLVMISVISTAQKNETDSLVKLHEDRTLGLPILPGEILPFQLDSYYFTIKSGEMAIRTQAEYDSLISQVLLKMNLYRTLGNEIKRDTFPEIDFNKHSLLIKRVHGQGCQNEYSLEMHKDAKYNQYILRTNIVEIGFCRSITRANILFYKVEQIPLNYEVKFETRDYRDSISDLSVIPEEVCATGDYFLIKQLGEKEFYTWIRRGSTPYFYMEYQRKWVLNYEIIPPILMNSPVMYRTSIRMEIDSNLRIIDQESIRLKGFKSRWFLGYDEVLDQLEQFTGLSEDSILLQDLRIVDHRFVYFFNLNREQFYIDALNGTVLQL